MMLFSNVPPSGSKTPTTVSRLAPMWIDSPTGDWSPKIAFAALTLMMQTRAPVSRSFELSFLPDVARNVVSDPSLDESRMSSCAPCHTARLQNVSRVIPVYANRVYRAVWHGAHDDIRLSSSDGSDTTLRATSGRKLNSNDLLTGARVCIISVSAAKAIFGDQSPVGESIHIGASRLTVVGVFDPEGGTLLNSIIGDAVVAPYT